MIHVLFVESGKSAGGSYTCLYQLLKRIDRNQYTPYVILLNCNHYLQKFSDLNVTVHLFTDLRFSSHIPFKIQRVIRKLNSVINKRFSFLSLSFLYLIHLPTTIRLKHFIRNNKIEIVYINGQINRNFFSVFALTGEKIKSICHLHSQGGNGFTQQKALIAANAIDVYIANSNSTASYWINKGLPENKIKTVYNAVQKTNITTTPNIKKKYNINLEKKIIGCIGSFNPQKRHSILLKAFQQLTFNHEDYALLLVGEGSLESELLNLAQQLGIQNDVWFLGYQEDIHNILTSFDLLVLPANNEAFGLVLIESMLSGTPVIGTISGGIPEIIQHEQNGLLVEQDNPIALSKAMLRLFSDTNLREKCIRGGLQTVKERFTIEKYIAQIEDTLCSLSNRIS